MPWSWGSVGGCLRSGRARKSAAYKAAVADAAASDGLDVAGSHPPNSQVRQYLPMTTLRCACATDKEVSELFYISYRHNKLTSDLDVPVDACNTPIF